MSITFNCVKCGKQFRVGDELAGKKGKCPKCNSIFQIPKTSQAVKKKPKPAATAGGGGDPFAAIGSEAVFAADFASGETPPARRPQQQSGGGVWISITFLLILLGSVAAAGFLHRDFFLSPPGLDRDLRYLPDDCKLIVSINVDAILSSSTYQRIKEEAGIDIEKQFEQWAKVVTLPDVRRLTIGIGLPQAEEQSGNPAEQYPSIAVLRFNKPVDIDSLKKTVIEQAQDNKLPKPEFKEVTAGRFTMHVSEPAAMAQVGEKTLVLGPVEGLRSVLERNASSKLSPPMQEAFSKVDFDKTALALIVDTRPVVEEARNKAEITAEFKPYVSTLDSFEAIKKVEAVILEINLTDGIVVSGTAICDDPATAEQFKNEASKGLASGNTIIKGNKEKAIAQIFDKNDATVKGKSVTVTFSTDIDRLLKLQKELMNFTR